MSIFKDHVKETQVKDFLSNDNLFHNCFSVDSFTEENDEGKMTRQEKRARYYLSRLLRLLKMVCLYRRDWMVWAATLWKRRWSFFVGDGKGEKND